jgi:hypothetical protein
MARSANLPVMIALLLAMTAALISADVAAGQAILDFTAQALRPQISDLGTDPEYLLGTATEVFPLPPLARLGDSAG